MPSRSEKTPDPPVADPLDASADNGSWSGDPLAQFLAAAWRNTVNSFTAERDRYRTLTNIDAVFRSLVGDAGVNDQRLASTFLVRSHASFLAAASLALSGQVAESYGLMRSALEASLHGLYIAGSPERQQQWLARNDDQPSEDRAAQMLSDGAALVHLHELDPETAQVYERLHARTIHRGAHPNTYANLAQLPASEGADVTREYFVCGDDVQRSCLRSMAQVGICCLSVFYYVFSERYRELELGPRINKLRQGH